MMIVSRTAATGAVAMAMGVVVGVVIKADTGGEGSLGESDGIP